MNTIAVFTTSRADFGLYTPLLKKIETHPRLDYELFVGGTHLSKQHGETISEVEETGLEITDKFDFVPKKQNRRSLLESIGTEIKQLAELFERYDFDILCMIGDRFEFLPVVYSALLYNKHIIHIHGGETTKGAVDEQFRHMITKGSHLHFAACDEYAKNIEKMGEAPDRVFNTGALGIDNVDNRQKIPRKKLFAEIGLDSTKKTVTMTYHPVTLEFDISPEEQINNLFEALSKFDFQLLVTGPNIDPENEHLREKIKDYVRQADDYYYRESLGITRYHNMIDYSEFILGNSSSGIIEVPYFKKPTVNIGTRQEGRVRHKSVIDTGYGVKSIQQGIKKALSEDFQQNLENMSCKFGDGHAAQNMVEIIDETNFDEQLLKKELIFPGENDG